MVVGVGRVESICQAIFSSIPENVRVNNKTGCALTDEPLTYSETVIFCQTSMTMHQVSIYYDLFWQGLRRQKGHQQQELNIN